MHSRRDFFTFRDFLPLLPGAFQFLLGTPIGLFVILPLLALMPEFPSGEWEGSAWASLALGFLLLASVYACLIRDARKWLKSWVFQLPLGFTLILLSGDLFSPPLTISLGILLAQPFPAVGPAILELTRIAPIRVALGLAEIFIAQSAGLGIRIICRRIRRAWQGPAGSGGSVGTPGDGEQVE